MQKVKLNKVCKIGNGFAFKSEDYLEVGVPLLRISNINEGIVNFKYDSICVSENNLNTKKDFIVEKGDVVIALSGATTGKYGIYVNEEPALLNQRIGIIKSNSSEKLDSKYFYFYLNILRNEILRKAGGAAQPNISTKDIGNLEIPLPNLPTQQKIANILDKADELRQYNKQLIEKYEALTQSLFLDMFGDPLKNENGWEKTELRNVTTKIGSGSTPRGGKEAYHTEGISLIRSLNIYDNEFKYKNLAFINNDQANKLKNVTVENNDVLFNITGASVCRCTVVPDEVLPARVNQHVSILRPILEILHPLFLSHLLISENIKNQLLGVGSAGGAVMEAITKEQLEKFKIPLPPIKLQIQFAERVKLIAIQKQQAQEALAKNELLFQGLLQQAFNGELN